MLYRRGTKTDPCVTPFLRRCNQMGEAAVCDKLHDHFDHVPVWQLTQKLAGEAVVPYSITVCCEINKHNTSLLFCQNALLNVLSQ